MPPVPSYSEIKANYGLSGDKRDMGSMVSLGNIMSINFKDVGADSFEDMIFKDISGDIPNKIHGIMKNDSDISYHCIPIKFDLNVLYNPVFKVNLKDKNAEAKVF